MNKEQTKANSISAVITTFNRPKTLKRAMESVTAQTVIPFELIVIDNGGQLETYEVVSQFSETSPVPVRFIRENIRGASAARNRGIKEVETDYIAFLDDDDVWANEHLSSFLKHIVHVPSLTLYAGWTSRFSDIEHRPDFVNPNLLQEYDRDIVEDLLIRGKKELSTSFYTPSMSASIINITHARQTLFDEELEGREDIYFVWLLGELGDIVIHNHSHAYVDQLDVSLFSLPSSATHSERLAMDLKKSYWGVKMLEKIHARKDMSNYPGMNSELRSAYFDYAYTNIQNHDVKPAITFGLKSAQLGMQVRHLKLLLRILITMITAPINQR